MDAFDQWWEWAEKPLDSAERWSEDVSEDVALIRRRCAKRFATTAEAGAYR